MIYAIFALMAAAAAALAVWPLLRSRPRAAVPAAMVAVAFAGGVLSYWSAGSPNLPANTKDVAEAPAPEPAGGLPPLATMVTQMEQVMADRADDPQGWLLLAKAYADLGRSADAARALSRAIALEPENADLRVRLGETLVRVGEGRVTPAARLAFAAARRLEPAHPAPHYFDGLALMQAGEPEAALDVWRELAASSTADAPWMGNLSRRIAAAERMLAALEAQSEGAAAQP